MGFPCKIIFLKQNSIEKTVDKVFQDEIHIFKIHDSIGVNLRIKFLVISKPAS